jgi:hypothetical protein
LIFVYSVRRWLFIPSPSRRKCGGCQGRGEPSSYDFGCSVLKEQNKTDGDLARQLRFVGECKCNLESKLLLHDHCVVWTCFVFGIRQLVTFAANAKKMLHVNLTATIQLAVQCPVFS